MFAPNASSQWDSDSDDDTEFLGRSVTGGYNTPLFLHGKRWEKVGRDGKRMGNISLLMVEMI
jgi:hypothetical protein